MTYYREVRWSTVVQIEDTFLFFLAVDCGSLAVPKNGSSKGSSTIYPDVVTFECDKGFQLRGSAARKCQANRKWSGDLTACEGMFLYFLYAIIGCYLGRYFMYGTYFVLYCIGMF
jgi:hypothetical protein